MTEDYLDSIKIKKAEEHHETEHLVIDIGGARTHISLADGQAVVTVHDSDRQASIILDDDQDVETVSHPDDVACVERTEGITDPMATTSTDGV